MTTLGAIAELVGGVTKDSKRQADPEFIDVPYLRVANVQRGWLDLDDVTTIRVSPAKAATLRLQPGDVLFNEGGDRDKLGRGWVWEGQIPDCIHQNHVFRARLHRDVLLPKLLSYYGNFVADRWFESAGKQTTNLASISLTMLASLPVPVPPLGEQVRLIEEVERRLSRLDAGVRSLQAAQRKLSITRQAILTRAVEGRLWADGERRLEISNDASGPHRIPAGWRWVRLRDLLREPMRNGRSAPTAPEGEGVRTFTITAVTKRSFILDHTKWARGRPSEVEDLWVEEGDILVQRSNTPNLVGSAALYSGPNRVAIFPDLLIRIRPNSNVMPQYLEVVLRAEPTRHYLRSVASGLAGSMPKIDQTKLGATWIPLPPARDEQERIVAEVDRRLSLLEAAERTMETNLARAHMLRRAIVRDAFSGRLVPQDPTDEPAKGLPTGDSHIQPDARASRRLIASMAKETS